MGNNIIPIKKTLFYFSHIEMNSDALDFNRQYTDLMYTFVFISSTFLIKFELYDAVRVPIYIPREHQYCLRGCYFDAAWKEKSVNQVERIL